MKKPRVVYWAKQPTPYFVGRFNAVARRGTLNFTALFHARREGDRSWDVREDEWEFDGRLVPSRRRYHLGHRIPLDQLVELAPDVVVQEYDRPYLALGFLVASAVAGKTAFRVLPNYDSWSERTWWREASKHFLFRAVDGAKVSGTDASLLASRYGLPGSRCFRVAQSIDVEHFATARSVTLSSRTVSRQNFGLHGFVFIYVGRLWAGKGLDDLLAAYAEVRTAARCSLLIVGDGVDEEKYRELAAGMSDVVFAGFVQPRDLPNIYALGDALVFPTLGDPNGLVVEEAITAGLPIIASSAAGDIAVRVTPERGSVYEVGNRDALAAAMVDHLHRGRSRIDVADALERWGHEAFAETFDAFVRELLALPRRTGVSAVAARASGRALLRLL